MVNAQDKLGLPTRYWVRIEYKQSKRTQVQRYEFILFSSFTATFMQSEEHSSYTSSYVSQGNCINFECKKYL